MAYVGKITDSSGVTGLVGSTLYGTCTTAAGTADKEVVLADFDKLLTGVTVHVKFTNSNTADNPTLNVNSTGKFSIYKYGTTAAGKTAATSWSAGAVVSFTYDGTAWIMNDHIDDTNSNTYDRTSMQVRIYAGGVGVFPYCLCAMNTDGRMEAFTTTGGDGSSKTLNTTAKFLYPPVIMYHSANSTIASGSVIANNVLYEQYPSANMNYSTNVPTAQYTQYKPLFMECVMNSDGTWSMTTTGFTQTFTAGKFYILFGGMYSTSKYQLALFAEHPMLYYDGTTLRSGYIPMAGSDGIIGDLKINTTGKGFYVTDGNGTTFPGIIYNGSNLFVGMLSTSTGQFIGQTGIATGYDFTAHAGYLSASICVPNTSNSSATEYSIFHTGNLFAGTGLSITESSAGAQYSGNKYTINHSNSITAGTAKGDDSKTLTFGGTFTIPTVTYDAQGHITAKGTTTMTMPSNPNSDTKVTQVLGDSGVGKNYPLLYSYYKTTDTTVTPTTQVVYRSNSIYINIDDNSITAADFIGTINGHTVASDIPSGALFTDEKVKQTAVGSSYTNYRPLVISAANSATAGFSPSTVTDGTFTTAGIYCQPSSGTIYAAQFNTTSTDSTIMQLQSDYGLRIYTSKTGDWVRGIYCYNSENTFIGSIVGAKGIYDSTNLQTIDYVYVGGGSSDPILKVMSDGKVYGMKNWFTRPTPSSSNGTYIKGRDNAVVYANPDAVTSSSYFFPAACIKTNAGTWCIGNVPSTNNLIFSYTTDANYASNTNTYSNYTISTAGAFSGTASAWTTARTLTLGSGIEGSVSVKGNADMTLNANLRSGFRYKDASTWNSTPWHMVATWSSAAKVTTCATFLVYAGFSGGYKQYVGILYVLTRSGSTAGAYDSSRFYWLTKTKDINLSDFVLTWTTNVDSTCKFELYWKQPDRYTAAKFTLLSCKTGNSTNLGSAITFTNNSTENVDFAAIPSTVTGSKTSELFPGEQPLIYSETTANYDVTTYNFSITNVFLNWRLVYVSINKLYYESGDIGVCINALLPLEYIKSLGTSPTTPYKIYIPYNPGNPAGSHNIEVTYVDDSTIKFTYVDTGRPGSSITGIGLYDFYGIS